MNQINPVKMLIITIITISAPVAALSISSMQTTKAQSSSDSDSYYRGSEIGNNIGVENGYTGGPYLSVDPNQYCNGDSACNAGFENSFGSGYNTGELDKQGGYDPRNDLTSNPETDTNPSSSDDNTNSDSSSSDSSSYSSPDTSSSDSSSSSSYSSPDTSSSGSSDYG